MIMTELAKLAREWRDAELALEQMRKDVPDYSETIKITTRAALLEFVKGI